ncbi:MAG TPA: HAMP domain-containing sensor histidine kinase [Acidobacteriota bacterium]
MVRWIHRIPLLPLMVGGLLALLAVLAVLQYRWTGEVSEAELQRMQASLRERISRFTQDFDSELSRAFSNFNIQMEPVGQQNLAHPQEWVEAQFSQRYYQWIMTASYPRLVSDLFLIAADESGHGRLLRFDRETSRLNPADWPAEFGGLRARLEERFHRPEPGVGPPFRGPFDFIDAEIPALIAPMFLSRSFGNGPPSAPLLSCSVVRLDRRYLEKDFIDTLARRYFFNPDGAQDYDLAIVSRRDPEKVIYQSDRADELLHSADGSGILLSLHPEMFQNNPRGGPRGWAPGAPFDRDRPHPGPEFRRNPGPFRPPGPNARDNGRWQLMVKHRGGSLESVVASARHRNLLISFGILFLLASSMALIVVSTQRAQRLVKQQMDFVASVSHELHTPLAVVCSAGENLADGVIHDAPQVRRYGELIRNEGRRLAKMVEQILEFSGIQSGRRMYRMRRQDIGELIENAEAACEPQIREQNIHFEKELQPNLPAVRADATALTHSIQNLLINGIKYGGGSRWLKLRAVEGVGKRGPEIQITVEDRGPGIAPADLPHIFEPFYRGQGAIAAQIHGNGLGLSLVKNIVEAHGGSVSVDSKPGRGSAFTLHLPALAASDANENAAG